VAVGGLLAMEGVSVLPQMALPVWFVWALTEMWLRPAAEAVESGYLHAPLPAQALIPVAVSSVANSDV
jgi:hypothetical protein